MAETNENEKQPVTRVEHLDTHTLEVFARKFHTHMMEHIAESEKQPIITDEEVDNMFDKCE